MPLKLKTLGNPQIWTFCSLTKLPLTLYSSQEKTELDAWLEFIWTKIPLGVNWCFHIGVRIGGSGDENAPASKNVGDLTEMDMLLQDILIRTKVSLGKRGIGLSQLSSNTDFLSDIVCKVPIHVGLS
ncbi:hypothetical protein L1887_15765 [Cichorium endivia]|nr:hypothetical protein L1887_15765 [Cichorium endivia]